MLSLQQLLDLKDIDDRIRQAVASDEQRTRPIEWAHVVDVEEPEAPCLDHALVIADLGQGRADVARGVVERLAALGPAALALRGGDTAWRAASSAAKARDLPVLRLADGVSGADIAERMSRAVAEVSAADLLMRRSVSEHLTAALLGGQGMYELLELGAELVHAPVLLVSPRQRVIAAAGVAPDEDPASLVATTSARADVEIRGWLWGTLHVHQRAATSTATLEAVLDRLPTAIAIEISRSSYAVGAEERPSHDLVADLLAQGVGADADLAIRAELAGLPSSPDAAYVGLAMPLTRGMPPRVMRALQAQGVRAIHARFAYDLVVLAMLGRESDPVTLAQRLLEHLPHRSGPAASISGPLLAVGSASPDLAGAGRSLREARNTLALANDIGIASAVVTAKSLSVDRLITRLLDDPELERFTTETLGPLIRYDVAHSSQLVLTLDTYMRNSMSKTRTAQDLFVRRPSLYRRLERIEEVLGSLNDHEFRLKVQLALKAQRLLTARARRRQRESWWLELRR
jgi:purine catabolism regulator